MISFWRGLKQLVTKVDRFGGPFELCLNGESTFKSLPGAVLTLTWTGLLIWYTYLTILSIVDKTNPNVNSKSVQTADPFELISNNILPMFVLVNKTGLTVVPNQLHNKFATFTAYSEQNEMHLERKIRTITRKYYEVKPCSQIINKKPYKDILQDELFKDLAPIMFQCIEVPENEPIQLIGSLISNVMKTFKVAAYPCSLANSGDCMPQAAFENFSMAVLYKKHALRLSNYEQPFDSFWTPREEQNMLMDVGTAVLNYVSNYRIFDNDNSLNQEKFSCEKATVEKEQLSVVPRKPQSTCTSADIAGGACSPYFVVEYRSTGIVYEYTRTYMNFLVGFSNIGGFKELLTVVCIFLYSFWNNRAKEVFIRKKVVEFDSLKMLFENQYLKANASREAIRNESIKGGPFINNCEEMKLNPNPHSNTNINIKPSNLSQVSPSNSREPPSGALLKESRPSRSSTCIPTTKRHSFMDYRIERKFTMFSFDTIKKMRDFGMSIQNTIDRHTNIVTLVQELSTLRVLALIIMTPYQRKLLPLVGMVLDKNAAEESVKGDTLYFSSKSRDKTDRKGPAGKKPQHGKGDDAINRVVEYIQESLSYEEALQALVDGSGKDENDEGCKKEGHRSDLQDIRSEINKFMLENLPDWVKDYLPPKSKPHDNERHHIGSLDKISPEPSPIKNRPVLAKCPSGHLSQNNNHDSHHLHHIPRRSIHRMNSALKTHHLPPFMHNNLNL